MNIDAHQHFWIYDPLGYAWIGPEMAPLQRDFLPDDLRPQLQATGFDGTVAVQARESLAETTWLLHLADQHPFICGVVGWVDLCSPDVRAQLARFAAHPRFVGVRHGVQSEPDDRFVLRADFQRGIAALAEFDLAYDLLLFPRHLPPAYELVARFPEQRFVLDHLAKPPIRAGRLDPWRADLRRLAALPNITCKVSGLVTEAEWPAWRAAPYRQYLDVVFEAFGPQRILLGSDWPVCTLAADYSEVLHIALDYIAQFAPADQADLCGGNAERVYKLAAPTP